MAESGLLDDVEVEAPLLWDLDDNVGAAVDAERKCKLRVDLIPLLRILRPRLLSSTLMQMPSILAAIPKHSQAREIQERPPDYSNLEAWSAHPQRLPGRAVEDVNHLKLPDETIVPPKLRPCDCFFVHDSTLIPAISSPFGMPPRWNAPLREPAELVSKINEQTDLRVAAGAAPFNRLCRIYAPRYRQVNVMCIALMMPPSPFARWKQLEQAMAQKAFGRGFLRLVTADGHALIDPMQSLHAAGLQEGDHVTAVALQAKMTVTKGFESEAFALWCCGGDKIVTWGNEWSGGDSSEIQDQLIDVQQVQSTGNAFAALLADGSVVTWGGPDDGGDSSEVQDQLENVQQIQATAKAFAAVLANGSIVTWGYEDFGGDSSAVQDQLRNVQQIQATTAAFAATLADGSVVTWGIDLCGGDSLEVQDQLRNVKQVQATQQAFAAIKADGSVATWGSPDFGGDSSEVQDRLRNVCQVQASNSAFAAILSDGGVVTWGDPDEGGDSSEVQDQLRNVQQIQAAEAAFAAILADGSVVTWGYENLGGDSSKVQSQLRGVQQVQAAGGAFAAILADRSVVTWGYQNWGGDSSAVQDQLRNVQQIQATQNAFAAILDDGSVVTWGDPASGGDSSEVQDQLRNVQQIQASRAAFAAILADGTVVAWGDPEKGGDSSAALEVAYQDVRRAFVRFIEETKGRPFFIAGHSQGTMHLTRLLQEEIDPFPSRARRFLHGYLAGQTVPLSIFQPMKHLRPSRCATDLTAPPGVLVVVVCGLIFHARQGWKKLRREILATNPITWRSGVSPEASKASEYRGAAFPLPRNMPSVWEAWPVSGVALRFGNRARESVAPLGCRVTDLSRIECGKVSARVDHTGATRVPQFPKDCWFTLAEDDFLRYHDLDIALFFGNLRANCEERYRAFLPRGRL
eukprot:s760_g8.t1